LELLLHSLIHLAAGASTAYVLSRKVPASILKRCWLLLIGALAGLFPDFTKFFGDIFFHSVFLMPVAGLICAFVYRIFRKDISFKQQWLIFSICVCTHLFIDYIGNGVAFLYPIIEHEYELSIVQRDDVIILCPLMLALIIGIWFRNGKRMVWAGVIISVLYIGALAGFKMKLENALEQRYKMEHVQSLTTYPNEFRREWRFMLTTDQTAVFGRSNLLATDIQIDEQSTFPSVDTALPVEPITITGTMTLSRNDISGYLHKPYFLNIEMLSGNYSENWSPGPLMGAVWTGEFQVVLRDESNNEISQVRLNDFFMEVLLFNSTFTLAFDDYNGDGNVDFTIGQYGTSNGNNYKLFTLTPSDEIQELKVRGMDDLFIGTSDSRYSTLLEKVDAISFKKSYYNNSTGKNVENIFTWEGQEFVKK
jgi:hypothetical protein